MIPIRFAKQGAERLALRITRPGGPSVTQAVRTAALVTGIVLGLTAPEPALAQPAAAAAPAGPKSSEQAYQAQSQAADPSTPGLVQPIPFSHQIHAGQFQIPCLYCHTATDKARVAGVPSLEVCMGCHAQFGQDLEGVQILKQHWDEKKPVEWAQIHHLPEHVKFRHNRHVAAGVACQRCHGPVETMDKVVLTSDTIWWPWLLPSKKLEMGWCINCHRDNQASQDCLTCHY